MSLKRVIRTGVVAGVALAGSTAWATPCELAVSSYESYVSLGESSFASEVLSNHPECFAGGPTASRVQINATSFTQALAVSSALTSRLAADGPVAVARLDGKGMAAGSVAGKVNLWGNLNQNDTRQSYTAANGFTSRSAADILTATAGIDYSLSPTMVVGVSVAIDNGDGWGRNTNPLATRNRTDTSGYTVAPYLGVQLDKHFYLDASVGIGRGEFDTNTNTEAEANRWFGAANLTYNRWLDKLQLLGKLSYLHGVEDYDDIEDSTTGANFAGTDAKNTIDQMRLGLQAGYWMQGFMPYASATYVADIRRRTTQFGSPNDPIDRNAWLLGLGVNYYSLANGVTGGLAYNREVGRGRLSGHNVMANLSIRF